MCYWVGTKNVREEMLRRRNEKSDNEITQLFYQSFVAESQMQFYEHYVAVGKSSPTLSVIVNPSALEFRNMKWGLPLAYYNEKTGKNVNRIMLNSTSEKVFFVHKSDIMQRRCVVPLDGYYEFFHFASEVFPFFIKPKNGLFFVAGVWSETADPKDGKLVSCFSMLTTQPNSLTQKLHNNPKAPNGPRMLSILSEEKVNAYLDPEATQDELKTLFTPYEENKMEAYPVIPFLRKEFSDKVNTEAVRNPVDYPQLLFADL